MLRTLLLQSQCQADTVEKIVSLVDKVISSTQVGDKLRMAGMYEEGANAAFMAVDSDDEGGKSGSEDDSDFNISEEIDDSYDKILHAAAMAKREAAAVRAVMAEAAATRKKYFL